MFFVLFLNVNIVFILVRALYTLKFHWGRLLPPGADNSQSKTLVCAIRCTSVASQKQFSSLSTYSLALTDILPGCTNDGQEVGDRNYIECVFLNKNTMGRKNKSLLHQARWKETKGQLAHLPTYRSTNKAKLPREISKGAKAVFHNTFWGVRGYVSLISWLPLKNNKVLKTE